MNTTTLDTYTDAQLVRIDRRIFDYLDKRNGCSMSWDWPTLRMCHPELATTIRTIRLALYLRRM